VRPISGVGKKPEIPAKILRLCGRNARRPATRLPVWPSKRMMKILMKIWTRETIVESGLILLMALTLVFF
jgi:hypothetical protein